MFNIMLLQMRKCVHCNKNQHGHLVKNRCYELDGYIKVIVSSKRLMARKI